MPFPSEVPGIHTFLAPIASTNGDAACTVLDTQGLKAVLIVMTLGVATSDYTVFKIQEADFKTSATALTTPTDITGTVLSAATTPVWPLNATSDGKSWGWWIPITGQRKRFINPLFTSGATSIVHACWGVKFMTDEALSTDAQRGFPSPGGLSLVAG